MRRKDGQKMKIYDKIILILLFTLLILSFVDMIMVWTNLDKYPTMLPYMVIFSVLAVTVVLKKIVKR